MANSSTRKAAKPREDRRSGGAEEREAPNPRGTPAEMLGETMIMRKAELSLPNQRATGTGGGECFGTDQEVRLVFAGLVFRASSSHGVLPPPPAEKWTMEGVRTRRRPPCGGSGRTSFSYRQSEWDPLNRGSRLRTPGDQELHQHVGRRFVEPQQNQPLALQVGGDAIGQAGP